MEIDPRLRDTGPSGSRSPQLLQSSQHPPHVPTYNPIATSEAASAGHPSIAALNSSRLPQPHIPYITQPSNTGYHSSYLQRNQGGYPPPTDHETYPAEGADHSSYPPISYSPANDGVVDNRELSYSPPYESPRSTQSGSPNEQHVNNGPGYGGENGAQNNTKRPRACEACRRLKVRCDVNLTDPEGACKRCAKANRNCVVTAPSRKRQKKTDSRVAELEKKIDALTQSLHAKGMYQLDHLAATPKPRANPYEQVTNGSYASPFSRSDPRVATPYSWNSPDANRLAAPPMVIAGQKRKFHESKDQSPIMRASPISDASAPLGKSAPVNWMYGRPDNPTTTTKQDASNEYADAIDRGILTSETASHIFDRYVKELAPHLPAVVFPKDTTAAEIRKTQPILFLAILSAASGTNHPNLQRILTKEVMAVYADRIICRGEKTLELIQALLVSTIWYWPPEHFEELKFYTLIHLAAVMAIDIGISKRLKSTQKTPVASLWRDHQWRRTAFPSSEALDSRRTWLGCYFMCCNASMGLRRPNLIRWTTYMDECVEVLETSPEAAPTDRFLCQWIRSQQLSEVIGVQFSMDDPFAKVTISDPKVQYALKGFENELERWSERVPDDCKKATLRMTEHIMNLYMHEVAMHVDHNVEEFKPPFTEENLRGRGDADVQSLAPLTAAHISALSACLTSIEGIYESFLSLEINEIRSLPVFHFVRIAYATVVLIKMFFTAAVPRSELGQVIDKDNMKVEYYLDSLLEKFRAVAAEDKSRPASKFLMVLVMLKTWFSRQRASKTPVAKPKSTSAQSTLNVSPIPTPSADLSRTVSHTSPKQQHREYSPANTPLQLLSEVATTAHTSRPESRNQFAPISQGQWQAPQQSFNYADPNTGNPLSFVPSVQTNTFANFDPSFVGDFDGSTVMETAVGMTIGDMEFSKYFSDDAFFGAMMDSNGMGDMFEGFSG